MEAEWKALLVDMGFAPELAEKALRATGATGVEAAIEYIQKLQEEEQEGAADGMQVDASTAEASKPPAILTEEERKARDARIEQLRVKVTAERAEKERLEALGREKSRRTTGQEISAIREKYQEQETLRLVAERKREKDIDKKERDRLRALIEQDKLNRKRPTEEDQSSNITDSPHKSSTVTAVPASAGAAAASKPSPTDHKETRIQIRQLNGERLVQTFQAIEPLSAVRLYCELNRTDNSTAPFVFIQPHPRREFSADDYQTPLKLLDLVPSGSLIMTKPPTAF